MSGLSSPFHWYVCFGASTILFWLLYLFYMKLGVWYLQICVSFLRLPWLFVVFCVSKQILEFCVLCFQTTFTTFWLWVKCNQYFDRNCIESVDSLECYCYLILSLWGCNIFFLCVCIIFSSFQHCLCFSKYRSFASLVLFRLVIAMYIYRYVCVCVFQLADFLFQVHFNNPDFYSPSSIITILVNIYHVFLFYVSITYLLLI